MLIQNTGSERIKLGFVSHGITLDVNEIADIPEVTVENPSFKNLENLGVLTIVDYEVDPTRLAVKQEIDEVTDDLENRVVALESSLTATGEQTFDLKHWSVEENTIAPLYHGGDFLSTKKLNTSGFVTRAEVSLSQPVAQGTIVVSIVRNLVPIASPEFIITLGVGQQSALIEFPPGLVAYEFTKNDDFGAQLQTTNFLPNNTHVSACYLITRV